MAVNERKVPSRRLRTEAALIFFVFAFFLLFLSPVGEFLLWRIKMNAQVGRSESQVLEARGEPIATFWKDDPPKRLAAYPPLLARPIEHKVLLYGFMNVRALVFLTQRGIVSRAEFVALPSQVADHAALQSAKGIRETRQLDSKYMPQNGQPDLGRP